MSDEKIILDQIRNWLKQGAAILANDPKGKILERQPDGSWVGGLRIIHRPGAPKLPLKGKKNVASNGKWEYYIGTLSGEKGRRKEQP